jgi:peroxiredoxin
MAQLRRDYPKFVKKNAEVIAVGPEDKKSFSPWWRAMKMPFPGIPDPKHEIARLYGQQVKLLKLGRMPELVVVDKSGNMRFKRLGKAMSDIPGDAEVLALLDELNQEGAPKGVLVGKGD